MSPCSCEITEVYPFLQSRVPEPHSIRDFAIQPHPENVRLHCTMIRHEEVTAAAGPSASSSSSAAATADANFGVTYTLYLEHLGGFLPLLKGKKVSKIRPEFVIYDPSLNGEMQGVAKRLKNCTKIQN